MTTMTEDHVRVLLTTLTALDTRYATTDAATAAIRVSAWAKLLDGVDPAFAMRWIEGAYRHPRDWVVQPGEILQAWRQAQTEAQTAVDRAVPLGELPGVAAGGTAMTGYLRDVLAAHRAGRPVESVPRPTGARVFSRAQDARERRCVFHALCACPHTDCREGFLDAEGIRVGWQGQRYPTVERCPSCHDALLMAEERGMTNRPRGGARRR